MKALLAIVHKDLTVEGRARELAPSMTVLALLLLTAGSASGLSRSDAPALLWITLLIVASLGLARSFSQEIDQDQLGILLMAPIDPVLIYAGKGIANFIVVMFVEAVALSAFFILHNVGIPSVFGPLVVVLLLGTAGVVALGTLLGAMLAAARVREALLPLLLLPIAVPALVSAVKATEKVLSGETLGAVTGELQLLAAFALVFGVVPFVVFEFVVRD
ncbi:MAG: heme exporter protein CcmB [bacterium]